MIGGKAREGRLHAHVANREVTAEGTHRSVTDRADLVAGDMNLCQAGTQQAAHLRPIKETGDLQQLDIGHVEGRPQLRHQVRQVELQGRHPDHAAGGSQLQGLQLAPAIGRGQHIQSTSAGGEQAAPQSGPLQGSPLRPVHRLTGPPFCRCTGKRPCSPSICAILIPGDVQVLRLEGQVEGPEVTPCADSALELQTPPQGQLLNTGQQFAGQGLDRLLEAPLQAWHIDLGLQVDLPGGSAPGAADF